MPDRGAIPPSPAPPRRSRVLTTAFALLTVLTLLLTYPQVRHMDTAVPDVGDPLLNVWALAWVAHQAPIAPARLFDGNIFYPERWTLAYSEPMLVPALAAAPLHWMGVGPITVYNIVLLSAIVISGVGATLLVLELTADAFAAVVAGVIFAFLPFRLDHYSHFQLQQTVFIPLTMWALHRVVDGGGTAMRRGALLGAFAGGQFLSCVYFGVFLAPYLAAAAIVLLVARARVRRDAAERVRSFDRAWMRRTAMAIGIAAVTYAIVVAPVARAHLRASEVVGERQRAEASLYNAGPISYLAPSPSSYLYGSLGERFGGQERNLFPGFLTMLLAVVALLRPWSASTIAYLVAGLVAFDLSLGFNGLMYNTLWTFVTPFRGIRVPARMGLFTGFSLAVLAGFGLAHLNRSVRSKTVKTLLAVSVSAVVMLESARRLEFVHVSATPPPIYEALLRERGDAPTAAILEWPLPAAPTFMYYSTFHWQNLLNGYSGFFPPSYLDLHAAMERFPDESALLSLLKRGTRFVIVHGELMAAHEYAALVAAADAQPGMRLIAKTRWQGREQALYRLLVER